MENEAAEHQVGVCSVQAAKFTLAVLKWEVQHELLVLLPVPLPALLENDFPYI